MASYMTVTEAKMMKALETERRVSYTGVREAGAARRLEMNGFVKRTSCDGTYYERKRDGSYSRRYQSQGYIEKS